MMTAAEDDKYTSQRKPKHVNMKNHIIQLREAKGIIITFIAKVGNNHVIVIARNRKSQRRKELESGGLKTTLAIEGLHPTAKKETKERRRTNIVLTKEGCCHTSSMGNRNLNFRPFIES